MILYKDSESEIWEEMKNPPSTFKEHMIQYANFWGFDVRCYEDGRVVWEYYSLRPDYKQYY